MQPTKYIKLHISAIGYFVLHESNVSDGRFESPPISAYKENGSIKIGFISAWTFELLRHSHATRFLQNNKQDLPLIQKYIQYPQS